MSFSKRSDLDLYVKDVLSKIRSDDERRQKFLMISRLYFQINEYKISRQYLLNYLERNSTDIGAHKLLGQIEMRLGRPLEAFQAFDRSYLIDSNQRDMMLIVYDLLLKNTADVSAELYNIWYERLQTCFGVGDDRLSKLRDNHLNGTVEVNGHPKDKQNDSFLISTSTPKPPNSKRFVTIASQVDNSVNVHSEEASCSLIAEDRLSSRIQTLLGTSVTTVQSDTERKFSALRHSMHSEMELLESRLRESIAHTQSSVQRQLCEMSTSDLSRRCVEDLRTGLDTLSQDMRRQLTLHADSASAHLSSSVQQLSSGLQHRVENAQAEMSSALTEMRAHVRECVLACKAETAREISAMTSAFHADMRATMVQFSACMADMQRMFVQHSNACMALFSAYQGTVNADLGFLRNTNIAPNYRSEFVPTSGKIPLVTNVGSTLDYNSYHNNDGQSTMLTHTQPSDISTTSNIASTVSFYQSTCTNNLDTKLSSTITSTSITTTSTSEFVFGNFSTTSSTSQMSNLSVTSSTPLFSQNIFSGQDVTVSSGFSLPTTSAIIFGNNSTFTTSASLFGSGSTVGDTNQNNDSKPHTLTSNNNVSLFGNRSVSVASTSSSSNNKNVMFPSVSESKMAPFSGIFSQNNNSLTDFASLALSSNQSALQSCDKDFKFENTGAPVFASYQATNDTVCNSSVLSTASDNNTSFTEGEAPSIEPHFEPVIRLPEVIDQQTGEEDEMEVFNSRAKLYRWDVDNWKERGIGNIKILRHKDNAMYRIIMRRDQILKLACNHRITSDLSISTMENSCTSWVWSCVDFSDGESKPETFAVRFKTKEMANGFKVAFDKALSEVKNL